MGLHRSLRVEHLRAAVTATVAGAQLVAVNRDALVPVADGVLPGAGATVATVEAAGGARAITLGKPEEWMRTCLSARLAPDATVALVGDQLSDVIFALRAGWQPVLVTTGVYVADQELDPFPARSRWRRPEGLP